MAVDRNGVTIRFEADSDLLYRRLRDNGLQPPEKESFLAVEREYADDLERVLEKCSLEEAMYATARLLFINKEEAYNWGCAIFPGHHLPHPLQPTSIPSYYGYLTYPGQTVNQHPRGLRQPSLKTEINKFPIAYCLKIELIDALVTEYAGIKSTISQTSVPTPLGSVPQPMVRKKSLAAFDKLTDSSLEDIQWAAAKFVEHIFQRLGHCTAAIKYTCDEILSGALTQQQSLAALQAMEVLWAVAPFEREAFLNNFRPLLAQRKHRKKKKDSNSQALNTTISAERKAQLEELSEIKGKPQYKVLEELIYHAYKECKR